MDQRTPERIICLTAETTETLYLLEEQGRIVGVSSFSTRPGRALQEKPVVATYTTALIEEIQNLQPDLVLGFSDLQASIASELIQRGLAVHIFNQRSVTGILQMIRMVGGLIDCADKADALISRLETGLGALRLQTEKWNFRPKVYFEEWDDPLISGIRWISELVTIAGGDDCFAESAREPLAENRVISDPTEVVRRQPDVILGSWCGKPFDRDRLSNRPGWDSIPAVKNGRVFEIAAPLILQPGPAALSEGLAKIHEAIAMAT